MQLDKYETGSGGFVWQNIQPDELFSRIQLHVYTAFEMTVGQEWAGSQFINHYNRIYYVKSGHAQLEFKDRTIEMKPDHLYFIPPYQLLSHKAEGELDFIWTHFQARLDVGLDLFMLYGMPAEVNCVDRPEIKRDFLSLVKQVKTSKPSAIFERNRLMLGLLTPFMSVFEQDEAAPQQSLFKDKMLVSAVNSINENIANPPDIKTLALQANLSPEHFSRKFKRAFSVAPKRYILQKRIALAKQKLLQDNSSIDSIAEQCGFCDIFHFSRIFKQETGFSPSKFRAEYDLTKLF